MGLACLLVGFVVANVWNRKHPTVVQVQSAELHRTLDLSQYGTYRGDQPASNPPLHLPAALLRLELVLPRLSQPGAYSIMVCVRQERPQSRGVRKRDRSGCRSADRGYRVSRPAKCDTGQVRFVDSTAGRRCPLHLSVTNRVDGLRHVSAESNQFCHPMQRYAPLEWTMAPPSSVV